MKLFEMTETTGHEQILFCHDQASGLRSIVAIHDASLGFAMGATRLWPYATEAAALRDVLRLSRGMTYKAACANIPVGGGKAVIIAKPEQKTDALLRAYGRFIDRLNGRFVTGQDVNLNAQDVRQICKETRHVVGTQERSGGPVAATALGILLGIQAAVKFQRQQADLVGLKVAVQGLGNVGAALCEQLHERGAKLFVTDINPDRVSDITRRYGATAVEPEAIYAQAVDVFSPCALGAILNDQTIPKLRASIVAGSANNQLEDEQRDGQALFERGILYCPDYVINGGGLINVYHEMIGYEELKAFQHVQGIYRTLIEIFEQSRKLAITPNTSAYHLADQRIANAKQIKILQSA
ncbi:MAG: Glu/Leu/Phe/Val dehydrogenase dimerization domain-containing protein [Phormidesmis sp.]